jgi:hypothetical protein
MEAQNELDREELGWLALSATLLVLISLPRPAAAQAGTFSPSGTMSTARTVHTATLLANGTGAGRRTLSPGVATFASAEIYDPNTGLFSPTGSLSAARHQHTATLLANGTLLVAVGDDGAHALASVELYAPQQ